ncbi:MarR family winged helix-turn-helix transcriptional regulator [Spirillospora sp. NPDC048911]|uniref:MarR family winged helix-turn-helix transcriptional regulator n=1 Tax=Spirillospora sp. NPDC048911 TaxID=3364527 RepID=UPI00371CAEE3
MREDVRDAENRDVVDELVPTWENDGVPAAMIANLELGKRVAWLGNLLEQAMRAELAELGLTYAEFDVLVALRRAGEPYRLKPTELTRALFLTSGGTSNVLQRLTKEGYVERDADPGDARSRWVRLTPEGLRAAEAGLKVTGRAQREVMAGVPEETMRRAADALREVLLVVGRRRVR